MSESNIYQIIENAINDSAGECGIHSDLSAMFTSGIMQRLQQLCGGNTEYFPKRLHRLHAGNTQQPFFFASNNDRDDAIRREFTGANHKELGEKYRCSARTVRRAVDNKQA